MNRSDLQGLSKTRLKEAKLLLANGFSSGAYYLAGYAIECALKACIAKSTRRHDFPDRKLALGSHTHNLKELLKLAQMEPLLELEPRMEAPWKFVQEWSEESRYRAYSEHQARQLLDAIANRKNGVMPWITRHW